MFSSGLVQTSLTVVWSLLGVVGWILGARRGQRGLWLAGAVLMAVVLAKLVLVDRGHLGNLLGIASFIAYGLLCTAVGYFAPAPPRAASAVDHARGHGMKRAAACSPACCRCRCRCSPRPATTTRGNGR